MGNSGADIFLGKNLIWPGLMLTLAFFSYHGAKPLILPIVLICLGYRVVINKSLKIIPAVVFLVIMSISLIGFLVMQKISPDSVVISRGSEIVFLNKEMLSAQVNDDRRISIDNKFKNLMTNKLLTGANMILRNYAGVFSGVVFFTSGDPTPMNNFSGMACFIFWMRFF